MQCELCGKLASAKAIVEGVDVAVCARCAPFGKVLDAPQLKTAKPVPKPVAPEISIVSDAGERIKHAREKQGFSQKDFALRINEHQSVLQRIESGRHELTLELARKLEKTLRISLVEESMPVTLVSAKSDTAPVTIGDLLKRT